MENLKTGTTTIGIVCKDGVILAADRRATAGHMIVYKKTSKIIQIAENIAITTAGSVSDIQLLSKLVAAELRLIEVRTGRKPGVKETANLLAGMVYSNLRQYFPGISHFVLGGFDSTGTYVYDIGADGSLMQATDYTSSGSGSVFALGVLESQYEDGLTLKQGSELAEKSLRAAIQRDSASGNGIDVLEITQAGMKKVVDKEL